MFDDKFLEAVRNKNHYDFTDFGVTTLAGRMDWDNLIQILDSHPLEGRNLRSEKLGFILTKLELRASTPVFIKDIIKELKSTFPKNNITAHFFGGFTDESKSFDIHRDKMDVLYLQILGDIEWSVWHTDKDLKDDIMQSSDGKKVFSSRFTCGNMIWIPRGTFHLVQPYTSRLGVSFGVEGQLDPSTYV